MSLSRIALRPSQPLLVCFRLSSTSTPGSSHVQLQKPAGENVSNGGTSWMGAMQGFFSYTRNWSRDPKVAKLGSPPQKGDLPSTFLFRRLGHAYEVYPLLALGAFWVGLFCYATYWSFAKVEVWLDRSQTTAPWDWERIRNNYWKKSTVAFDLDGRTRQRLELMEMLQDEMLEAAKKRGTR